MNVDAIRWNEGTRKSTPLFNFVPPPVRPDWAIYWTLSSFSKPLATFSLPKYLTILGNFCKGVKNFNFTIEIIFGQLL